MFEDYLKAVNLLTINQDTKKLEKKFNEFKGKKQRQ